MTAHTQFPSFPVFFRNAHGVDAPDWVCGVAEYIADHGRFPNLVDVAPWLDSTPLIDVAVWGVAHQIANNTPRTLSRNVHFLTPYRQGVFFSSGHTARLEESLQGLNSPVLDTLRTLDATRPFVTHGFNHAGFESTNQSDYIMSSGVTVSTTTPEAMVAQIFSQTPGVSTPTQPLTTSMAVMDAVWLVSAPHLTPAVVNTLQEVSALQSSYISDEFRVPVAHPVLVGSATPTQFRPEDSHRVYRPASLETPQHSITPVESTSPATDLVKCVRDINPDDGDTVVVLTHTLSNARKTHAALTRHFGAGRVHLVTSQLRDVDKPTLDDTTGMILVGTQSLEGVPGINATHLVMETPTPGHLLTRLTSATPGAHVHILTPPEGKNPPKDTATIYPQDQLDTTTTLLRTHTPNTPFTAEEYTTLHTTTQNQTLPRYATLTHPVAYRHLYTHTPEGNTLHPWVNSPDTPTTPQLVTIAYRTLLDDTTPLHPSETIHVPAQVARHLLAGTAPTTLLNPDTTTPTETPPTTTAHATEERLNLARIITPGGRRTTPTHTNTITPGTTLILHPTLGGYTPTEGITYTYTTPAPDATPTITLTTGKGTFPLTPTHITHTTHPQLHTLLTDNPNPETWGPETLTRIEDHLADLTTTPPTINTQTTPPTVTLTPPPTTPPHFTTLTLEEHHTHVAAATHHRAHHHTNGTTLHNLTHAAANHDIGKAHPGFQTLLGAQPEDPLLAKSTNRTPTPHWANPTLPPNYDHALAAATTLHTHNHPALTTYLTATHHGHNRTHNTTNPATTIIPTLTHQLTHTYGPWGLTWLEHTLRTADWEQSHNPTPPTTPHNHPTHNPTLTNHIAHTPNPHTTPTHPTPTPQHHNHTLTGLTQPTINNWYTTYATLYLTQLKDPTATITYHNTTPTLTTTLTKQQLHTHITQTIKNTHTQHHHTLTNLNLNPYPRNHTQPTPPNTNTNQLIRTIHTTHPTNPHLTTYFTTLTQTHYNHPTNKLHYTQNPLPGNGNAHQRATGNNTHNTTQTDTLHNPHTGWTTPPPNTPKTYDALTDRNHTQPPTQQRVGTLALVTLAQQILGPTLTTKPNNAPNETPNHTLHYPLPQTPTTYHALTALTHNTPTPNTPHLTCQSEAPQKIKYLTQPTPHNL